MEMYYYGARYYDPRGSIFHGVDPMSDKFPDCSPFNYCKNNPVMLVDPNGRETGWYDDGSGPPKFNPDVHSQKDMKKNNLDGKYLGEKGVGVDPITGCNVKKYNSDGTTSQIAQSLPAANIQANDPYPNSRIFYNNDKGYGPALIPSIPTPDYIGVSLSGNAFLGGGVGVDATIGYVKGEGYFANFSLREGVGVDISAGIGVNIGNYYGPGNPSCADFSNLGSYQNFGSAINLSSWQDISSYHEKPIVGALWRGGSIDFSFGSKTIWGGSTGLSITTKPLR